MLLFLASLTVVTGIPRLVEAVDPITDQRSVYLAMGNSTANVAMGCSNEGDASSARVVIHFDQYVGDATPGILAGGREVQYRFDQRTPSTAFWYAHDHDVFAESSPTKPVQFMLEAKASTRLNFRSIDLAGDRADISLSYPDPTALIDRVLVRCGFTVDGRKPRK